MRTTLDIPPDLFKKVAKITEFRSKTDMVIYAMTELLRRRRLEEFKEAFGNIPIELDVDAARDRPTRPQRKRPPRNAS